MSDTLLQSYPVGGGKLIPVDHTGPVSYPTGGETLGTTNNFTGISLLGLSELDAVLVVGIAVSGNYWVVAKQVGTGNQKTFKLLWFTASSSVPSFTQVSNATNLSAETVRLVYVGR